MSMLIGSSSTNNLMLKIDNTNNIVCHRADSVSTLFFGPIKMYQFFSTKVHYVYEYCIYIGIIWIKCITGNYDYYTIGSQTGRIIRVLLYIYSMNLFIYTCEQCQTIRAKSKRNINWEYQSEIQMGNYRNRHMLL